MRKLLIFILILASITCLGVRLSFSEDFEYVKDLFSIRESITDQGKVLPVDIKEVSARDLRTLERIFELNTSALTTIEAYFRILKIALITESEDTSETITILNEWLSFIKEQCGFDLEYLDATFDETKNEAVLSQIDLSRDHAKKLIEIANKGIVQNNQLLQ